LVENPHGSLIAMTTKRLEEVARNIRIHPAPLRSTYMYSPRREHETRKKKEKDSEDSLSR
jgi:hypothetical protein